MTSPRPLSRRTALRGAGSLATAAVVGLAGLATAGCRSLRGGDAPPAGASPSTSAGADAAGTDGDAAIVTLVRRELSDLHADLVAVRTDFPALRSRVDPLVRLHARHAGELGGLVARSHGTASRHATSRPRTQPQALDLVTTGEATLQVQLTHAATDAASGVLAATLASMVAAVAQLRVDLGLASAGSLDPALAPEAADAPGGGEPS